MIDIVTSAKNPSVKRIRKLLGSNSYRQKERAAVGEGSHIAGSYLKSGNLPEMIVYAETALKNHEVDQIVNQLELENVPALTVKDSVFESISDISVSDGVIIIFSLPEKTQPTVVKEDSLLLEAVQDPGNLGTILRTSAAAGVRNVYLSPGSASPWSPKVLRSGMGAQFSLEIYESANVAALAQAAEVPVIATDLSGKQNLYEIDLSQPVAWVFGNEGQGVTSELLASCTDAVVIPQADTAVESLNVAAAAAVCLFEQRRQRLA